MSKKPAESEVEPAQHTEAVATTSASAASSADASCLFTFDAHPYFSFPLEPYAASKYGSQVRERKIDRCLKQLQEALKTGK
ncbi:hypothetical protein KR093_005205 [Drosophila rubida]|uniref:Uncharacterized protein n=1 Tax=Drosophila rubida TaxID=30044 RepID=A0AAD4PJG3_9MUSC|nr:hypothetical protein KR093_005205 [Drosophila rubida]